MKTAQMTFDQAGFCNGQQQCFSPYNYLLSESISSGDVCVCVAGWGWGDWGDVWDVCVSVVKRKVDLSPVDPSKVVIMLYCDPTPCRGQKM